MSHDSDVKKWKVFKSGGQWVLLSPMGYDRSEYASWPELLLMCRMMEAW